MKDFLSCTGVGNKKNKVWLIYAYDRSGGEIVAYA